MGNELDLSLYPRLTIVELRRYAMKPGRRDDLITLFAAEFIETQERCGAVPIGHFRDDDDPNAFIWFRGYANMEARLAALEAFYLHSPAWSTHRDAANSTIEDSDNVLLLRPARLHSGFALDGLRRDALVSSERAVAATIVMLGSSANESILDGFERTILPALEVCAQRVAYFVTEETPNNFPRHPVRDEERAFVAAGCCANPAALEAWSAAFDSWNANGLALSLEHLRLRPAARSLFC
jgi:hypothetical protein